MHALPRHPEPLRDLRHRNPGCRIQQPDTAARPPHHCANGALFRTMFNTEQLRGLCIGGVDEMVPHERQKGQCPRKFNRDTFVHKCIWEIQPGLQFEATSEVLGSPAPSTPAKFCGPFSPGSTFSRDRSTAIRWSNGFELGGSLDIKAVNPKASFNSTAQTGYDNNDFMVFKTPRKPNHENFICGANRSAGFAAQVVLRARKPKQKSTSLLGRVDDNFVAIDGDVAAASGVVVVDPHAL